MTDYYSFRCEKLDPSLRKKVEKLKKHLDCTNNNELLTKLVEQYVYLEEETEKKEIFFYTRNWNVCRTTTQRTATKIQRSQGKESIVRRWHGSEMDAGARQMFCETKIHPRTSDQYIERSRRGKIRASHSASQCRRESRGRSGECRSSIQHGTSDRWWQKKKKQQTCKTSLKGRGQMNSIAIAICLVCTTKKDTDNYADLKNTNLLYSTRVVLLITLSVKYR